jgi:formamidopyrimidine-DNA glycosylase
MPEGPEVRIMADGLSIRVGWYLRHLEINTRSRYASGLPGHSQLLQLLPALVTRVWAKGKKIIIDLHTKSGPVHLVSLPGEAGRWSWVPENWAGLSLTFVTQYFDLSFNSVAYFDDSRKRGHFFICFGAAELGDRLKAVGPDLLNETVKYEEWYAAIRKYQTTRDGRHRQICEFLMDQKAFSGIGNYLKAEILYVARVRPDRLIVNITDVELFSIFSAAIRLIRESYLAGGLTIEKYLSMSGQLGVFKKVVYGNEFDPLGNVVRRDEFADGRTSHWVPAVQT